MGKPISRPHLAALGISFLGIALLIGARFQVTAGLLLAFACAIGYAGYMLMGDRIMATASALSANAVIIAGAAVTWVLLSTIRGASLVLPTSVTSWVILAAFGLAPTLGSTLLLAALARIGASKTALISMLEPIVTVALAWLLLGERLGSIQLFGAALALGAVAALQWPGPATRLEAGPVTHPTTPRV
jgi:drug/metabolite transporter (DMT)-like permease